MYLLPSLDQQKFQQVCVLSSEVFELPELQNYILPQIWKKSMLSPLIVHNPKQMPFVD